MRPQHEKKKKSGRLPLVIAGILILAGVCVIAWPYVLQRQYSRQAELDYEQFAENAGICGAEGGFAFTALPDAEPPEDMPNRELYMKMREYNETLYEQEQEGLSDPWSYQQPSFDLEEYGFEENVIGYIEIPKIGVVLPIYLGATSENMLKGAAQLGQTSLPIGGENTNCVICAHRGYYGAEMFKHLVELEAGDEVIVTNLWYTMTYRVVSTATILDSDIDELKIQDGRDLISLFTCFYQNGRKDRFVAYCERAEQEGE